MKTNRAEEQIPADRFRIVTREQAPDDGGRCPMCDGGYTQHLAHVVMLAGAKRPLCPSCADASPVGPEVIRRNEKDELVRQRNVARAMEEIVRIFGHSKWKPRTLRIDVGELMTRG